MKTLKQVESIDAICETTYRDLPLEEAEFQGKKVTLNDPIRGGSKKFYVYVKDGDKVKKVSFGDTTGLSVLNVMILQDENPFVQDITVILQKIKHLQDTGLAINGVLALK